MSVVVHVEDWKLRVELEICVVFLLDVDLFIGGDGADEQKPSQQCATNVKRVCHILKTIRFRMDSETVYW